MVRVGKNDLGHRPCRAIHRLHLPPLIAVFEKYRVTDLKTGAGSPGCPGKQHPMTAIIKIPQHQGSIQDAHSLATGMVNLRIGTVAHRPLGR